MLSSLTVLKVRFTCTYPAEFLNNLTFPAVEDQGLDWLKWQDHDGSMVFPLRAILSKSEVSSCLKYLRLRAGDMVNGALSTVLQLTPSLETSGVSMPFGDDIEKLAHIEHRKPVLVPRLKSLEFFIPKDTSRDRVPVAKIKQLIENRYSDWDGILNDIVCLEHLRIHCIDRQHAILWQAILEGWHSDCPDAMMLFILNSNLAKALPPKLAEGQNASRGYHQKETVAEFILKDTESFEINDIRNVYGSGIHHTLYRLADTTAYPHHRLQKWAARVLKKWEPLFKKSASKCKWMLHGASLVYITDSNRARYTAGFWRRMVFGTTEGPY